MFKKNCHVCKAPFESPSRNTKYCADPDKKCAEKAKGMHTSRHRRRRDYHKNAEDRRAQSMSRKQAREYCIAEHAISNCTRCGKAFTISKLEDHHRDGDPFNNVKDNLTLQCQACHPKSDTQWRKEKEEGKPISDVRVFKQLGTLVADSKGVFYLTVPGMTAMIVLPQQLQEQLNAANNEAGGDRP